MFKFKLLTFELFELSFFIFNSNFFKSVVITFIVVEFLLIKVDNLVACNVQELSGVGYNNNNVLAMCNVILEPHDCVKIQVICWLIQ